MKIKIIIIIVLILLIPTVFSIAVSANNPPNPPEITGPLSGKIKESYIYNILLTDPDLDDVMFNLEIDFGDDTEYIDCGCGKSWQNGTILQISHTWQKADNYEIKSRVQDASGEWSEWSETLQISMPRNKPYILTWFQSFLENHSLLFPILRQILRF